MLLKYRCIKSFSKAASKCTQTAYNLNLKILNTNIYSTKMMKKAKHVIPDNFIDDATDFT